MKQARLAKLSLELSGGLGQKRELGSAIWEVAFSSSKVEQDRCPPDKGHISQANFCHAYWKYAIIGAIYIFRRKN